MEWWLILLLGVVIGVAVVAWATMATRSKLPALRKQLVVLDEHKAAAMRLQERLAALQADAEALQAKMPQRG